MAPRLGTTHLLRLLAVLAVGGALLGLRGPSLGPSSPPIVVLDVSASVGAGPFVLPPSAQIAPTWYAVAEGVVARVARQASAALPRQGSRLSEALRRVAADYPGRTVWLLTDGRATDGDPAEAARALRLAGGRVDLSPPLVPASDVALLEARARRPSVGGAEVEVWLAASTGAQGRLTLVRDGLVVEQQEVALEPLLRQRLVLEDPQAPGLAAAYRIRWEPEPGTPDDDPGNDELVLGLRADRPSVLVAGELPAGTWAAAAGELVLRRMMGWEPGAIEAADAVVLSNLPWSRLGEDRVEDLVRFVAGGGRLLVLGGPQAWRAGGWSGTSIEGRLSPLRTPRGEGTDLALVVALDRSGSTAEGALPDLVLATEALVGALGPGERLAVLPFAATPDGAPLAPGWIQVDDRPGQAQVREALAGLAAGGGTDLGAAIEAAADLASSLEARERRVILVTDGDPDRPLDDTVLDRLRHRLDAQGVRFGAVVSDMPAVAAHLGRRLAQRPEDVVLLDRSASLPEGLLGELSRVRREAERVVRPRSLSWPQHPQLAAAFAELRPAWIQVLEASPEAEVVAWAELGDGRPNVPFAARRVVGSGEVVALAWGPMAEDEPLRGATALLPLVAALARGADRGLAATLDGGDVVVRMPSAARRGRLVLEVEGEARGVLLEEAPGRFRGPWPAPGPRGAYVRAPAGEGSQGEVRPLDLPTVPPPEHRGAGVDLVALERIARAGGGRRLEPGAEPDRGPAPPGPSLAPALLLLAILLFLWERRRTEAPTSRARSREEEHT